MNPHGFPHDCFRVEHVCSLIPSRIRINLVISTQSMFGQDYHYAAVSTNLADTALDKLIERVAQSLDTKAKQHSFPKERILLETKLLQEGKLHPLNSDVFEAWANLVVEKMNSDPLSFLLNGFKGLRRRTTQEILQDFYVSLPSEFEPKKGRERRWAFWRKKT